MSKTYTRAGLVDLALDLAAGGFVPLPVKNDGSKAPDVRVWPDSMPTESWIRSMFAGRDGIGILTGSISGNIEMLEIEGRYIDAIVGKIPNALGKDVLDLWRRLNDDGWCEVTPSTGLHYYFRISDGPALGNTVLARNKDGLVTIETRGERGFTIIAPSGGTTHQTGDDWWLKNDGCDFTKMLTITSAQRDALYAALRELDEMPPKLEGTYRPSTPSPDGKNRPGDDYNLNGSWDDLLTKHGWQKIRTDSNGETYWVRPGKDVRAGQSATTNYAGSNRLVVFSSSTPFEQWDSYSRTSYSLFAAYTLLNYGELTDSTFKIAAADLRAQGYGEKQSSRHFLEGLSVSAELSSPIDAEFDAIIKAASEPGSTIEVAVVSGS